MEKNEILNKLLKSLLENRLIKLEKKYSEEMKDLKIIKLNYSKQETLLKSFKIIKKNEPSKNKLLLKKKTMEPKLSLVKRSSARLYTPLHKKTTSKSKEKENANNKNYNNKDNFSHLNKSKIDGNYRKSRKNNINDSKNRDKSNDRIRKYKTPIRKIYHNNLNSFSKHKNEKNNNNESKTPSASFYKDTSITSYKKGVNNTSNKRHKNSLIDSVTKANKSYVLYSHNNLNKSNTNLSNSNLYINETSPDLTQNKEVLSLKKMIKININPKNKTNLYLEQFIDKEKTKKDNKKANLVQNFGEWLVSEEGREIFISISNYLDTKSKYHLFSCQKKYIKYLYQLVEDTYTEFKENNKINPNSNIIQEKINEIKEKYSQNDLNIKNNQFALSKSTLKALELLNDEEHDKFFNNDNFYLFSDDIFIVYKIIFQLIKNNEVKNCGNKKDFFEKMVIFVHEHIEDKNKIGDFFKNMVNEFEFSEENIFQIKKIIKGNEEKLKPKNYSQICATTGLVIFLVKDILEYLGLNYQANKGCPVFILMNLEFLKTVKTKLPNYLKFLKNLIKI